MNPEIERCRSEQARCQDHILRIGTDNFGAWLGASDWLHEEILIENELAIMRISEHHEDSMAASKPAATGGRP